METDRFQRLEEPDAVGRLYCVALDRLGGRQPVHQLVAGPPLAFGPLMDAGRYTLVLWGVACLQTLAIASALTVGSQSRASFSGTAAR